MLKVPASSRREAPLFVLLKVGRLSISGAHLTGIFSCYLSLRDETLVFRKCGARRSQWEDTGLVHRGEGE